MCGGKKPTRRLSKRKKPAVPANTTAPVQFIRPDDPNPYPSPDPIPKRPNPDPSPNDPNPYPSPNDPNPYPYPSPYPSPKYPSPNDPNSYPHPSPHPSPNDPNPYPSPQPSPKYPSPYPSPNDPNPNPSPYLSAKYPSPYPSPYLSPKYPSPYPSPYLSPKYPSPNDPNPYPNGYPSPKSPISYPSPLDDPNGYPSPKSLIPYHSLMPGPNGLDPILQAGSGMRYDIRKPPQVGIAPSTWQQISYVPALGMPTFKILIISKAFPWSIVISAPTGSVITCGRILEELHKQLQRHIEGAEWAMVAVDRTRKEAVEKAARSRQEKDKINRLKRIDWLGDKTMFEGLERDKEFEKKRHLPGSVSVAETWVVRFGKCIDDNMYHRYHHGVL